MRPTYHFISHSHWDREWYKTFETFRLDLVDMIESLLAIFAADPDYRHFALDGQTIVLEDYLEILPERSEKISRLIQDGRISIGPWYVLPDEFLVSGESTVRNLLFGRRIGEKFGPVMQVGYIPDSFGHLAMLPAILRGFDMDTAIVYRGFGGEPGQEKSEYRWQAPDGSEVLMIHLPPNGYGDAYIGVDDDAAFIRKGNELREILDPRATTPHRLCMNGGDHHFPEPYLPRALKVMNENCDGTFIHSSIPAYVTTLKEFLVQSKVDLQKIEGELRGGFCYAFAVQSGVYSSRMYLKQANHRCEKLLTRYAEPLAVYAGLAGRKNLVPMLRQGWKTLLQNHPHDSICGCSIDAVHEEMITRFARAEQIAEAVMAKSLGHLFPDAMEGPEQIVVFNPAPRAVDHFATADIEFFRQKILVGLNPNVHPEPALPLLSGFKIFDSSGSEVPFQILQHDQEAHGLRFSDYAYPSKSLVERFTVLLETKNVPGLGFSHFHVEKADQFPEYQTELQVEEAALENRYLRVEVQQNGSLNLFDKRTGQQFTGLHIFEDGGDAGDEYNYSYPAEDKLITSEELPAEILPLESGPLRAALEIRMSLPVPARIDSSRQKRAAETVPLQIRVQLALYHNLPYLECETVIENTAEDHRLRLLFPSRLDTNTSIADSQFGLTKRTHLAVNPEEYSIEVPSAVHPMQRGVTLLDGERGLTIATAGLPEYELKAEEPGTLAVTLLRCIGRLSGGDLLTRPGGEAGWVTHAPGAQCPGKHVFKYAIIPHSAADFEEYAFINEQLEAFLLPLRAVRRSGAPEVELAKFGLELAPSALVLSAVKPAEDSNGVVARFYNPTAKKLHAVLTTRMKMMAAYQTQLNERNIQQLPILDGRRLELTVAPAKIVSLRLVFGKISKKG